MSAWGQCQKCGRETSHYNASTRQWKCIECLMGKELFHIMMAESQAHGPSRFSSEQPSGQTRQERRRLERLQAKGAQGATTNTLPPLPIYQAQSKQECVHCGEPHDTLCESCARCVCYGCCGCGEDCDLCNECAIALDEEESATGGKTP